MNKINILNLLNLQKEIKRTSKIKINTEPDKFISSKQKFISDAIDLYSFSNLNEITDNLSKIRSWSDGINYIGYHKTIDDKILGVVLGKYDNSSKNVKTIELDVKEYKSFVTKLFAKFILKEPTKKNEYQKLYLEFLKNIDRNIITI